MTLEVTYAAVTRSGLETPWKVEVGSASGFGQPVTITTTSAYFERFDFNEWYPEPSGRPCETGSSRSHSSGTRARC